MTLINLAHARLLLRRATRAREMALVYDTAGKPRMAELLRAIGRGFETEARQADRSAA